MKICIRWGIIPTMGSRNNAYKFPDLRPKLTLDYTSPVESTSLGTVKAAFR